MPLIPFAGELQLEDSPDVPLQSFIYDTDTCEFRLESRGRDGLGDFVIRGRGGRHANRWVCHTLSLRYTADKHDTNASLTFDTMTVADDEQSIDLAGTYVQMGDDFWIRGTLQRAAAG